MLTLGTRGSALALWQANHVRHLLEAAGNDVGLREIRTTGDRILDVPLSQIGDKGLFTRELDNALLVGEIDFAVHSLKDLPTRLPDGICLAAVSEREEPSDAFVAHPDFPGHLRDLPAGAVIGTSSLRRQAQLLAWRSDLEVVSVRGNVDTRLAKLAASQWHGIILAAAGLVRLGLERRIRERIDRTLMLSAVSQGALGIVCRDGDERTVAILHDVIHHEPTGTATTAERAFLRRLEGGCQVPVGAYASVEAGTLTIEGCVASVDGRQVFRGVLEGTPETADATGKALAEALIGQGAGRVLQGIRG